MGKEMDETLQDEQATREALLAEIDSLRQQYQNALSQHRIDHAEHLVEKWIAAGFVAPACRSHVAAIARVCVDAGNVKIVSESGCEFVVPAAEVFEEILRVNVGRGRRAIL